jgi:uncharacterized membrane protein
MMSGDTGPSGRLRWPTVLLAVSLALNLFGLGALGGAWLARDARVATPPREFGLAALADALEPEARRGLRVDLAQRLGPARDRRRVADADLAAFLVALRAEPADLAALSGVLDAVAARSVMRMEAGHALALDRIGRMDRATREQIAERLERASARRPAAAQ